MDKPFEIVFYLNTHSGTVATIDKEVPLVLFTALRFLSQYLALLSVLFIISQMICGGVSEPLLWRSCPRLVGKDGAAGGCCSLPHTVFCGTSELRPGPMPEAWAFLSKRSFSGLPS